MIDDHDKYLDPEERMTCPYNPAHDPPRKRMGFHLQKCRKQHIELSKDFKDCMYNVTHKIPRPEYEYHLEVCPDRENAFNSRFRVGESENDVVQLLNENITKPLDIPPCEENWDEVEPVQSNIIQNIKRQAEQRAVLENYSNAPPAVRKAKREVARRKHLERMNAEEKQAALAKALTTPMPFESQGRRSPVGTESIASSQNVDDDTLSSSSFKTAITNQTLQSNVSYETALNSTIDRLNQFQLVGGKKKIGRGSGKIALNTDVPKGLGRGRLFAGLREKNNVEENLPESNTSRKTNKGSGKQ